MPVLGARSDTGARAYVDGMAIEGQRFLQCAQQCGGNASCARGPFARQQDREFVAAQPGHRASGTLDGIAQARSDFAQQQVADLVTERVVDVLEVIEVHQHDGDGPGRGRRRQRNFQLSGEHCAIGETGQRVAVREVHDARFARCNVFAHRAHSGSQVADLVVARRRRQRRVVSCSDSPRGRDQIVHRAHDAACNQYAGDHRHDHRDERDESQLALQPIERLHRGGQWFLQQHDDVVASTGGQPHHAGQRDRIVSGVALGIDRGEAIPLEVLQRLLALLGVERGCLQPPDAGVVTAEQRYVKAHRPAQDAGNRIVDAESDRGPRHR